MKRYLHGMALALCAWTVSACAHGGEERAACEIPVRITTKRTWSKCDNRDGFIPAAAFSPDGRFIACRTSSNEVLFYDVKGNILGRMREKSVNSVGSLSFHPAEKRLVYGAMDLGLVEYDYGVGF